MEENNKFVRRNGFNKTIYISCGYGKDYNEILRILAVCYEKFPNCLFICPIHFFSAIRNIVSYEELIQMSLSLMDKVADEVWVCDSNFGIVRNCIADINHCFEKDISFTYCFDLQQEAQRLRGEKF